MVVSFVGITTFLFFEMPLACSIRNHYTKRAKSNKFLPKYLEVTNIFLIFAAWKKKIYGRLYILRNLMTFQNRNKISRKVIKEIFGGLVLC